MLQGGLWNLDNMASLATSIAILCLTFGVVETKADEVNQYRCPYKNAKNICTATFKCLNQHFIEDNANEPICTGSEKLDYRPSWITDQPIKSNDEQ